jgi:PAS domain S-box-containing protein
MIENEILVGAFEAIPMPAFIVDAQLRIVLVNRAARESSVGAGLNADKLVGGDLMETLNFLPANVRESYEHILRTGEDVVADATYVVAGKTVFIEVNRFPIFELGRVTHVGVIFRDVTELRRTQEALRDSEETARALMNSSTESMFLIDENETVIAANATGAERLGMGPRELAGKTADQAMGIMPSEGRNKRRDLYRQVRTSGKPARFTDERMGRIFDISMFPVPDPSGVSRRVAIFARDVTERESMLKALGVSEKRFRDLFENIPDPTFVFHWDGTDFVFQRANAAASRLTDGKIGSLLGQTASRLSSERSPRIIEHLKECLSSKGYLVRESEYTLHTTGQTRFFEAHYVFVPPDEIMVHAVDRTARREAEIALQNSYASLEERVAERTRELAGLNEQLRVEREALDQKNVALRELITQINESKKTLASSIQTNLQRVTLPILERLSSRLDEPGRNYLQMLRNSLDDILSPHLTELQKQHPYLTAHEIDLCNLIKSGFTCKEIADMRGRSEQTILKQRKMIRKKLGLSDERINLRNYLSSVTLNSGAK